MSLSDDTDIIGDIVKELINTGHVYTIDIRTDVHNMILFNQPGFFDVNATDAEPVVETNDTNLHYFFNYINLI
jgi:hypothetical protein